jgi:hypothetical protein
MKEVKPVLHNTEFIKKDIQLKARMKEETEKGEDLFFYTLGILLGLMFLSSFLTGFLTVNLSIYNAVSVNVFTMVLNSALVVSMGLAAVLKAVSK